VGDEEGLEIQRQSSACSKWTPAPDALSTAPSVLELSFHAPSVQGRNQKKKTQLNAMHHFWFQALQPGASHTGLNVHHLTSVGGPFDRAWQILTATSSTRINPSVLM